MDPIATNIVLPPNTAYRPRNVDQFSGEKRDLPHPPQARQARKAREKRGDKTLSARRTQPQIHSSIRRENSTSPLKTFLSALTRDDHSDRHPEMNITDNALPHRCESLCAISTFLMQLLAEKSPERCWIEDRSPGPADHIESAPLQRALVVQPLLWSAAPASEKDQPDGTADRCLFLDVHRE